MNSAEEMDPSERKKRNLARKKVQEEMDQLRIKIRQLRKEEKAGKRVEQDLDACLGYLKVLKKEMDSIKEGSHSTFLTAKKYISPKFNYGAKKQGLLERIKVLAKEIKEAEKKLAGGGYSSEQRQAIHVHLEESKTSHQEVMLELKAIEQFNHTRFLEQKAQEETILAEQDSEEETRIAGSPGHQQTTEGIPVVKKGNAQTPSDFNPPPMI